jgi:hypothetical protein
MNGTSQVTLLIERNASKQQDFKFHEVFQKDEGWACEFTDGCREKRIGPDYAYFEIWGREEMRKKKGLPPRVTLLPYWDMGDEQRYDEDRAERRKQTAKKRRKNGRTQQAKADKGANPAATQTGTAPKQEEDSNQ